MYFVLGKPITTVLYLLINLYQQALTNVETVVGFPCFQELFCKKNLFQRSCGLFETAFDMSFDPLSI